MHQHNGRMRPAPCRLPEHSVQRRWAIGGLFDRMRGESDGLGLRHGWYGCKRKEGDQ
jgi:hypothetical protein